MKAKRILILVLTVLMLAALAVPAFAAETEAQETGDKMYITTKSSDTVSIRCSPGAKYESVVKAPYGAQVYAYEKIKNGADETWVHVEYYDKNGNHFSGYISERYLTYDKPGYREDDKTSDSNNNNNNNSSNNTVEVDSSMFSGFSKVGETCTVKPSRSGSFVNMRWAPSTSMPVVARYYEGDELYVIAENRSWCQVYDEESGVCGFMYKSLTSRGQ